MVGVVGVAMVGVVGMAILIYHRLGFKCTVRHLHLSHYLCYEPPPPSDPTSDFCADYVI